jgi:hypothetical protein
MSSASQLHRMLFASFASFAVVALTTIGNPAVAADLKLSGASEVPPVTTTATGSGPITVADDGSVSGRVRTTGVAATAAHIHVGAAGQNGPVIVTLTKTGDAEWSVPAGTKLSDEQMKSYKSGNLYVNVHSDANKGGEIRAQITP